MTGEMHDWNLTASLFCVSARTEVVGTKWKSVFWKVQSLGSFPYSVSRMPINKVFIADTEGKVCGPRAHT